MRPFLALVALLSLLVSPARAEDGSTAAFPWLVPPLDGPVVRRFDAPGSRWGPGHRGVDYFAAVGTSVRAAADGVVMFAGPVAGSLAVTILHESGLETTYSSLSSVAVAKGQRVVQGSWIGTSGHTHAEDAPGLHFGVKVEGDYVDPQSHLGPLDVSSAIHLVPLGWMPGDFLPAGFRDALDGYGSSESRCVTHLALPRSLSPPNDNIAVAIAGIGSKTAGVVDAAMFENSPRSLGYRRVYRFSYKGTSGPGLHEPYERADTWQGIDSAARRLHDLLRAIAERHPGVDVDLIAHSQGGIVARRFLAAKARAWDAALPRVEHLLTFASPHGGAPLAGIPAALERETVTGRYVNDAIERWAQRGGGIPDPRSRAVRQLAPGSPLLRELARQDVVFGTRVLALGIVNDVVVPADRSRYPGKRSRIVPAGGWRAHEDILRSRYGRALAYHFLRDADSACPAGSDRWGGIVGRAIGFLEARVPWLYGRVERALLPGFARR